MDKNIYFLVHVVLVKKSLHHVTRVIKGVKRLFLQFLPSFDLQKSILDDATVDIKMIVNLGQNLHFQILSIKGKFVICFRSTK